MKKALSIVILALCTMNSFSATAKKTAPVKKAAANIETAPAKEEIEYKALLLGDKKGNIYYSENIDEKYPLASVTKMMSIMLIFDEIRAGRLNLNDQIVASKEAATVPESHIPITPGEAISVKELLEAAAIKSANNAVYVMAEHVAGSTEEFVRRMNEKAKELGLGDELEFHTPAGLPTNITRKGMDVGTARGIYLLSLEALKYPEYMEIASMPRAALKNGTVRISNTNKLLGKEGINGIKTGYHRKSMFNIVIHSDKNGMESIVVVFGGNTARNRDQKVLDALEQFHGEYRVKKMVDISKPLITIPVHEGEVANITLYPEKDFSHIVSENSQARLQVDRMKTIQTPAVKGTVVGIYTVLIDGKEVEKGKLTLEEDINSSNMFKNFLKKVQKKVDEI